MLPCEVGKPSFRDVQCAEFNDWVYPETKKKHTWKGVFLRGENPCTLSCINEDKTIATLKPQVVDGTTCHRGLRDICIGGACREIPCDLDIESKAVEDVCGVCHGDGTECTVKRGKESIKQNMKKLQKVVDIPEGTRNIRVQEVTPTRAHIVVKEGKKTVINGDKLGMFQVTGSKAWLGMIHNNQEALNIPGPVTQALQVLVRALEDVDVEYSIGLKKGKTRRGESGSYRWDFIDWSPCSAQCGPGVQISVPKCVEKEAGLVEDIYCKDLEKPDDQERPCYLEPCAPRWMIGDWTSDCVDGKRTRIVKCVKPTGEGEGESVIIADSECKGAKPVSEESCGDGGGGKCSRGTEEKDEDVSMKSPSMGSDEDQVHMSKSNEVVEKRVVKRSNLDKSRRVDFLFSPDVLNNEKNVYTKGTEVEIKRNKVRSSKDLGLDKKETDDKMTEDKIHPPKWKRSKVLSDGHQNSILNSKYETDDMPKDTLTGIAKEHIDYKRQTKQDISSLSKKIYLPGSEYLDQDLTEYEEGPKASAVEKSTDDIHIYERSLRKRSPELHTRRLGSSLNPTLLDGFETYPISMKIPKRSPNKKQALTANISNDINSDFKRTAMCGKVPIEIEFKELHLHGGPIIPESSEVTLDKRSLRSNEKDTNTITQGKQSLKERRSLLPHMSSNIGSPLDNRYLVDRGVYPIHFENQKKTLNERSSIVPHLVSDMELHLHHNSLVDNEAYPLDMEKKESLHKRNSLLQFLTNDMKSPLEQSSLTGDEAYPLDKEDDLQNVDKRNSLQQHMYSGIESPLHHRLLEENEAYPVDMDGKLQKRNLLPHMNDDIKLSLDRRPLVESEAYPSYIEENKQLLNKRSSLPIHFVNDIKSSLGKEMLTNIEQPLYETSRIDAENNDRPLSLIDLEQEKELNDNLKKRYAVSRGIIEPSLSEDMVGPEVLDDLVGTRVLRTRSLLEAHRTVRAFPSAQFHDTDTMPMDRVMAEGQGLESQAPIMASGVENDDWQPMRGSMKEMTKRHSARKRHLPELLETSAGVSSEKLSPTKKLDVMIPIEVSFLENKDASRKLTRSYKAPSVPMKSEPDRVFMESVGSHDTGKEIISPKQRFFSREAVDEFSNNKEDELNSVDDNSDADSSYLESELHEGEEPNTVIGFYGLNSNDVPFGLVRLNQDETEAAEEKEGEEDDLFSRNNRDVNAVHPLSPDEEKELLESVNNNEADYGEEVERLDRLVTGNAPGTLRTRDTQSQKYMPESVLTAMDMSRILEQHLPSDNVDWKLMRGIDIPVGHGRPHGYGSNVRRATKKILTGDSSKERERCVNNSLQHGQVKGGQHKLQRGQTVKDKIKPENLNFTILNEAEDNEEGSDTTARVEGKDVLDAMEKAQEESHTQASGNKSPGSD